MGLGRVTRRTGEVCASIGALAAAAAIAVGVAIVPAGAGRAHAADADFDGVDDLVDNCPLFFNPSQADPGGLGSAGPDGIGSDCQCGDVTGDGRVQLIDQVRLAREVAVLGPPIGLAARARCRTNSDGICDEGDVLRIREALIGVDTIDAACEPANPPLIQITTPTLGSFSTATTLNVQGTVAQVDPNHLEVVVNGLPAVVAADNTWQVDVPVDPGLIYQRLNAQLEIPSTSSIARHSITTHFGDGIADGALSPMAAALRLNDIGLDKVEPSLTDLIDIDLETLIPPGELLIDDFCAIPGPFGIGCTARVDVTALGAAFGGLALDVDMNAGSPDFAEGDISIDDLFVEVNILGGLLNIINCDAEIRASTTLIEGDYEMDPDALDPTLVDVSQLGSLGVAFSNFDFDFTSGICDFPLIGDLVSALVGDVEPDIRQGLIDFLNDPDGSGPQDGQIGDAIEAALAELQIAQQIGEGIGIFMEGPLFDIEIDDLGITLESDIRATSLGVVPGAPDLLASYDVIEPFPVVTATTPVGGLDYDVGICVSSSAFNQMLKAQVEGGLLATELTEIALFGGTPVPLTAGLLGLLVPAFAALDPFDPLAIRLQPDLAPVVTGNTGPAGELQELAIGHMKVDVVSADGGPELNYMSVLVDLSTGFDMQFDPVAGGLAPTISEPDPADITIDFVRNPLAANEQGVKDSLPAVFAPLLPSLSDALGALPIPDFLGFGTEGVEVSRQGAFMSLFLDLVPAPPAP